MKKVIDFLKNDISFGFNEVDVDLNGLEALGAIGGVTAIGVALFVTKWLLSIIY